MVPAFVTFLTHSVFTNQLRWRSNNAQLFIDNRKSAAWASKAFFKLACNDKSINDFVQLYTGEFSNNEQMLSQPGCQYARKIHLQFKQPSLGEHCFFVKEESGFPGQIKCRVRIAVLQRLVDSSSDIMFSAKHFDFRDSGSFAADLSEREYIARAQRVDPLFDLLEIDESTGIVEFRSHDGGQTFLVETQYESCPAAVAAAAAATAAGGGASRPGVGATGVPGRTLTQIRGELSARGWNVQAKATRLPDSDAAAAADGAGEGEVVMRADLLLDRLRPDQRRCRPA